jgi:PAS domain S-box-containing protein
MKRLGALLAVLVLALVSGAAAPAGVEAPRTIRVVVDRAYAPYSFQSDDGELQGILIDQWRAWETKTGIKVEIRAMDWGEALRRMRAGEFDVIDNIVETPGRRDDFDFTPAYSTIEAPIYFRRDISGITDLASLKGFPVGVKTGDQHIDRLKGNGVTTLVAFQSNDAMVEAAKQHKISVFVADSPSALYLLSRMGIEDEFRRSAPIFHDELRRAVRKGDTALLRTVSEGFAAIQAGELKEIDEKWFGRTVDGRAPYLTYAAYAAAAAMLLLAGLVGWNRTLRKGILQRTAALGESERRFRQIAENIREVFWMCTPAMDELLYVSPAYESIWGRSVESLRQRPRSFIDAIHPEDRDGVVSVIDSGRQQGVELVYRIVRPDGSMRWIRDRSVPVKNESGKVYRIAGVAQDITERKQMDEALRHSEFDLAEAQRVAQLGSWALDIATGTVRWSEELYRIFDVEKTAFRAYETFLSRVHPDDRTRVLQVNAEARSSGKSFEVEYAIETRSGQLKHVRELGYAKRNGAGAVSGLFGTAQDITERKDAENALRASSLQLQALSRRLVELQESERKDLARELHDRIGQNLTALNINLNILGSSLPPQAGDEPRARLEDSKALVESTTAAIGNILSELRPPMLDEHGLALALDWYARQVSARAGIPLAVRNLAPGERPAPEAEIALFRIAQEALNNIVKHARASRAGITLERRGSEYVMRVEDDGVGFDAGEERAARRPGLGMAIMRERAQAVGGRFEVRAQSGSGTRLAVRVPA